MNVFLDHTGKNGVEIQAERVTLDLSGYRLVGVPGSLNGLVVLGGLAVGERIENGTIHDWGQNGILLNQGVGPGGGCIAASLVRIIVARNGQNGVRVVGGGSIDQVLFVREAALTANGADGLSSDLAVDAERLVASGNAAHGVVVLGGIVVGSLFEANGADGVVVLGGIGAHGGRVSDSTSARNDGSGIVLGDGMSATGCECIANAADGIRGRPAPAGSRAARFITT